MQICHTFITYLGDEYHYFFDCSLFSSERINFPKHYYYMYHNTLNMEELFNTNNNNVCESFTLFSAKILGQCLTIFLCVFVWLIIAATCCRLLLLCSFPFSFVFFSVLLFLYFLSYLVSQLSCRWPIQYVDVYLCSFVFTSL